MIGDVKNSTKYTVRALLVACLVGGLMLLRAAARASDAPTWWWILGGALTLVGGGFVVEFVRYRIRYPTPEARRQARERFIEEHREQIDLMERGRIAVEAVKHKKAILRAGVETTAVVTFLADAHRGNELEQLVYVELEVTRPGGLTTYVVKTGEALTAASVGTMAPGRELTVRVDPADPQRVAVDWEASLRLRRPAGGSREGGADR